jgi:COP9 signalosome complex subunit 4
LHACAIRHPSSLFFTPPPSPTIHIPNQQQITTMSFEERLAAVGQVSNQKDKIKGYQDLVTSILQEHNGQDEVTSQRLEQFVTAATEDSIGLVVSRQVLSDFTNAVDGAQNLNPESKKRVYTHALDKVQGRVVSFEDQVWCFFFSLSLG